MANTTQTQQNIQDPFLQNYWNSVQNSYSDNNTVWNKPYYGDTYVPMSAQTQGALGQIQGIAAQPNYLNQSAMNYANGLLGSGGLMPGQAAANAGSYGIANGSNAINTEGDWRGLLANSGNEAFGGVLDTQAGKLTDDIDRQFSASGRYGSAAHSGTVADQVGDFRSKAASDNWNQNILNQSNILGQIGNIQNTNIGNQLAATNSLNSMYGQAGQLGIAAATLSPTLYNQQYAGADRLASVGSAYDDLAARQLQSSIDKWNANQNQSLNNLQAWGGLLGAAGNSGSGTTSVKSPTNYASYLGAAGTAASGISDLLSLL